MKVDFIYNSATEEVEREGRGRPHVSLLTSCDGGEINSKDGAEKNDSIIKKKKTLSC